MTCDTCKVTCDTGHVTYDTWWGLNFLAKGHLCSFYGLGKTVYWRLKDRWINQLSNHKSVYRTSPATTGLLKSIRTLLFIAQTQSWKEEKNVCRQTLVSQRIILEDRAHKQSKGNLLIKNYCNILLLPDPRGADHAKAFQFLSVSP